MSLHSHHAVLRNLCIAGLLAGVVSLPAHANEATIAPTPAHDVATELMANARRAVQAGRLTKPAGDNAFEYYVAIRRIDAAHDGAREGIADLYPMMADAADAALDRGNWNEAARLVALIEAGVPDSRLAPRLRQRLEAAGVPVPARSAVAFAPH